MQSGKALLLPSPSVPGPLALTPHLSGPFVTLLTLACIVFSPPHLFLLRLSILAPTPPTARCPAARKATDAQQAALGEPPESARDTCLGEEGAGAAAAVPSGTAECGVGEVGGHHPPGGPGRHRPPDRGLSGWAAATHWATAEGCCPARSCCRTGTDTRSGGGQARAPASGHSDGSQAEARSAGTRARRDRR